MAKKKFGPGKLKKGFPFQYFLGKNFLYLSTPLVWGRMKKKSPLQKLFKKKKKKKKNTSN